MHDDFDNDQYGSIFCALLWGYLDVAIPYSSVSKAVYLCRARISVPWVPEVSRSRRAGAEITGGDGNPRSACTHHGIIKKSDSYSFVNDSKKINISRPWSARIEKNFALGLECTALAEAARAVHSRPRAKFFSIRTSCPWNNIYVFGHY